jgi:cytochrome c biogenesis protein CcmG/thiol:disulfide interchange protein DsbE
VEAKEAVGISDAKTPKAWRRRPLLLALQVTALTVVVGLLALLVWRIVVRDHGSRFASNIAAGRRPVAPAFTLPVIWRESGLWPSSLRPSVGASDLTLQELRGRPVVLNFWASWCLPCRDEAPILAAAARAYAGRVTFLGVDDQDLASDARRFLRRYQVPYPSVRDGDGKAFEDYGLTANPETYYVDARGRAVAHTPGPVDPDSLRLGIQAALRR